jgi:transcriptional regulator with XRE-family HTH domain
MVMGFGKNLQDLRKAAGLSQSELAERSGTSIDSLRNWEQERALPKIDAATRLARALGVRLDDLAFDGRAEITAAPPDKSGEAGPKKPGGRARKRKGA